MDVENLRTERNLPVDSSRTSDLPDYNIHLATRRISQFEGQFESPTRHSRRGILRILGSVALLSVLGATYKILSGEKASAQTEDLGVGQDYTRTYIDELGNRIEWSAFNGTRGLSPNNPDHLIDNIYVSTNGSNPIPFQFNETQFPPDTNRIVVDGHWVDTRLNIAYVPIQILRNSSGDGRALSYIGIILDARNVTNSPVLDTNKQKLITDLPPGGTWGDGFKYFKVGSDEKGRFINFGIERSLDPKENGDYIIRLDNNGLPVGGTVKLESAVMSRRGFIPFIGNAYTGK